MGNRYVVVICILQVFCVMGGCVGRPMCDG
jgi:hypothetical protein